MSTKTNYKVMTDAELIDEGLDCDVDSLAYELAVTLDALPINHGSVQIDDVPCGGCEDLQREVDSLEWDVSELQNTVDNLDMDRLIAGVKAAKEAVKAAKEAVKAAQKQVNFILGLGGDDHE